MRNLLPLLGERTIEDDGFGDYAPGRWCWELAEVRPLETPVPARGRQGWFRWDQPAPYYE